MSDEQTKGAINKVTGSVEETVGKLTGDKGSELHGKAKQVQGEAQKALGGPCRVLSKATTPGRRTRPEPGRAPWT